MYHFGCLWCKSPYVSEKPPGGGNRRTKRKTFPHVSTPKGEKEWEGKIFPSRPTVCIVTPTARTRRLPLQRVTSTLPASTVGEWCRQSSCDPLHDRQVKSPFAGLVLPHVPSCVPRLWHVSETSQQKGLLVRIKNTLCCCSRNGSFWRCCWHCYCCSRPIILSGAVVVTGRRTAAATPAAGSVLLM